MPTEEEKDDERASRYLVDVATSTTADLYGLLNITVEGGDTANLTENELNRAWKKAALKWHPDKNPGNEKAAADKLDEIRKALEVLRDPAARRAYEDKRRAKREKVEREQAFDVKRRRMKEDLERREGTGASPAGVKRKFEMAETEEEKRERELKRLAAEGARRRAEKADALRRAARQEVREREARSEDVVTQNANGPAQQTTMAASTSAHDGTTNIPEVDRTVKARWPRDHPSAPSLTKDRLVYLFSTFGPVESAALLKDKKARPSLGASLNSTDINTTTPDHRRSKKQIMATGVVVFASILAAHAAILAHAPPFPAGSVESEEWAALDSVEWASGPPASLAAMGDASQPAMEVTPKRTFQFAPAGGAPGTPVDEAGLRRVPSFASFGAASRCGSPAPSHGVGESGGVRQEPSLFEVTMMRLREAEKRRLEEQIRREEGEV